jgi:hypothetical protein
MIKLLENILINVIFIMTPIILLLLFVAALIEFIDDVRFINKKK